MVRKQKDWSVFKIVLSSCFPLKQQNKLHNITRNTTQYNNFIVYLYTVKEIKRREKYSSELAYVDWLTNADAFNRDYETKKRIKRGINSFVLFCWWEPKQAAGQYTGQYTICYLWNFRMCKLRSILLCRISSQSYIYSLIHGHLK